MYKLFVFSLLIVYNSTISFTQTNVSGGIFSNTTWSLSNSPYLVTSNIVVFPGYKLTIEPGVVVRFADNTSIEIRQSQLLAMGTAQNPIILTRDVSSVGTWDQLNLNSSSDVKLSYVQLSYSSNGIAGISDSLSVKNCQFTHNGTGISAGANVKIEMSNSVFRFNTTGQLLTPPFQMKLENCTYAQNNVGLNVQAGCNIIGCTIDSNSVTGLIKHMACNDTIRSSFFRKNNTAISNDSGGCGGTLFVHDNTIEDNVIGINLQYMGAGQFFELHKNTFCNNSSYHIQNTTICSVNATDNCWCTIDSTTISSKIYDAHDNLSYGIVSWSPINVDLCDLSLANLTKNTLTYNLFPNPSSNQMTLSFDNEQNELFTLKLYNFNGQIVHDTKATKTNSFVLDKNLLQSSIYLFELSSNNEVKATGKVIFE